MAKFPSQRKLTYTTGNMGINSFSALTSGGVSGHLNIPKDLSLMNRRGYASTSRKGVPLIYRCKVDFFLQNEDGKTFHDTSVADPSVANQQGAVGLLKLNGAQNNWVMRNAAVKWHAARDAMWKRAGISKKHLGAYAHEVRYGYDSHSDTWLVPIDGDGDGFVGGTWDLTSFTDDEDANWALFLVGAGQDEESQITGNAYSLPHTYLSSRGTVPADSNLETDTSPAAHSRLRNLLAPVSETVTNVDAMQSNVRNVQDNPPYDEFVSSDVNGDWTEPVELGRVTVGGLSQIHGSMIVDIPFGIADPKCSVYSSSDLSGVEPFEGLMQIEVLDIFEMQG